MEPQPDNKIKVQYPRCLDLRAMGGDRAMLGWIAEAANIWDMEVLEVADEYVSGTARFGTMDENGGSHSDIFKAIASVLDLCYGVRNQDWKAVEARRRELELEASPQAREEEAYRAWRSEEERQISGGENVSVKSLEIMGGAEDEDNNSRTEEEDPQEARGLEAEDGGDEDSSDGGGWGGGW